MNNRLGSLIQRAVLDVVGSDYNSRSEMSTIGRHVPYYIMSYLKSGEAMLRMNDKEYVITPGTITLIRPNVLHDHIKTLQEDAVFLWWHFHFVTSWNIDILRLIDLPVVTQMSNTERFESVFIQYLEAVNKTNTIPGLVYKNAKGLEVLAYLLDSIMSSEDTKLRMDVPSVFFDILDDVTSTNMTDISLSSISKKYDLNPTYISNRFKEHFGISPIFLHRELIVERAKGLLISTSLNIGKISDELGFNDIAVFTRFFTEKVGISPSKYRIKT